MNQDLNAGIPPRPVFPQGNAEFLPGSPPSPLDRLKHVVTDAEAKLGEFSAVLEERTAQVTELELHLSVAEVSWLSRPCIRRAWLPRRPGG